MSISAHLITSPGSTARLENRRPRFCRVEWTFREQGWAFQQRRPEGSPCTARRHRGPPHQRVRRSDPQRATAMTPIPTPSQSSPAPVPVSPARAHRETGGAPLSRAPRPRCPGFLTLALASLSPPRSLALPCLFLPLPRLPWCCLPGAYSVSTDQCLESQLFFKLRLQLIGSWGWSASDWLVRPRWPQPG